MNKKTCCPKLNINLWENKTHIWKNKLFLKGEIKQIFHIPINLNKVINEMFSKIKTNNIAPSNKDFLMLFYDPSPWKSEVYMTITKKIKTEAITTLSGTFVSKVFEGKYNDIPKWIAQMNKHFASKEIKVIKYYFHWAYCPKCAKKHQHNYCVAFAQIK